MLNILCYWILAITRVHRIWPIYGSYKHKRLHAETKNSPVKCKKILNYKYKTHFSNKYWISFSVRQWPTNMGIQSSLCDSIIHAPVAICCTRQDAVVCFYTYHRVLLPANSTCCAYSVCWTHILQVSYFYRTAQANCG